MKDKAFQQVPLQPVRRTKPPSLSLKNLKLIVTINPLNNGLYNLEIYLYSFEKQ